MKNGDRLQMLIMIAILIFAIMIFAVLFYPYLKNILVDSNKNKTSEEAAQKIIIAKETIWIVEWFSLTGDLKFGGNIGQSEFPSTFLYNWEYNDIYGAYSDYVGFLAHAYIFAPRSGLYNFDIGSDDGCELMLDGKKIISLVNGPYLEKSINIGLSKGLHFLYFRYWEVEGRAKVYFNCDNELLSWEEEVTKY